MSTEYDVYQRLVARWDAWSQQMKTPKDDESGKYDYFTKKYPLTRKIIDGSILGREVTIGAFTINPKDNTVRNPQVDFDNHDEKNNVIEEVVKLYKELKRVGYYPYIEASSGELAQGAHVGLICKPTDARVCKSVLDNVLEKLGLKGHEVFPKQTEVEVGKYGNLVKLPFQYNNRSKARSQIINPETMQPFERHDAINYLMALPDTVLAEIQSIETIAPVMIEDHKAPDNCDKSILEFMTKNKKIKPCIVATYTDKLELHGRGDEGHDFRLFIAGNLIYNGASDKQAHDYFKIQSDYSEKETSKQIKSTHNYLNGGEKPMGCKKVMELCAELLEGKCDTCPKKPKDMMKERGTASEIEINHEMIFTDMRNSKKLAKKVGINARYCTTWKSWVVFNGKQWVREDGGLMMRYAREVVNDLEKKAILISDFEEKKEAIKNALRCESTARLKSMVELCQSEEGITIEERVFDSDPMFFNVQNGTINLKTGILQPHNPLDYQMKISPVTFNKNAKCERWMKFIEEALGYEESFYADESEADKKNYEIKQTNIKQFLKRHAGYSLTGDTSEEEFLILFGDGGNGKSKYMGGISYVMGDYFGKLDIQSIQGSIKNRDGSSPTPDIAKLKGLRFLVCSEPEKGLKLNESRIKDFTGRDEITCRGLHEKPFKFIPEFKLVIYTNYRIIIRGQDKSIWRRVHQVGFNKAPTKIDRNLDKEFQKEASGILNWMLEGCLEWNKDGLSVPQEVVDDVAEYKDDMDVLSDFFRLCCDCEKGNKKITGYGNELFHVYQSWWNVEHHNNAPFFRQQFLDAISERGFKKIKKDMRGVIVGGIRVKNEVEVAYQEAKTIYDGFKNDAMTAMTSFLVDLELKISCGKKPDNRVMPVMSSFKTSVDNEKELTVTEISPLKEITSMIQRYIAGLGICVNSSNVVPVSLEFFTLNKKACVRLGYTEPSDIKYILFRMYNLTPNVAEVAA